MPDAYSVHKLAAYPDTIRKLRETGEGDLLTVHLMPQNACNQSCSFCSYRMADNKNSEAFNEGKALPWESVPGLLDDFQAMGVRGVELTGGGEPTAYKEIDRLLTELHERRFAVGLVTNGTMVNRMSVDNRCALRWVRVSIDAATDETYRVMRKAPQKHFAEAWHSVRWFAEMRDKMHPDFRLGVGFVLSNENMHEVLPFVEMAKDAGADNVRLSLTFSDKHLDYFDDRASLGSAVMSCHEAKEHFDGPGFTVHNMAEQRYNEQMQPAQDYRRCPTKDVLCVVEGEGRVYSCCTFTGSNRGLWGNYLEHQRGFAGVWADNAERRKNWDSRVECQVACLYRDRNLAMNRLIDQPQIHTEFV